MSESNTAVPHKRNLPVSLVVGVAVVAVLGLLTLEPTFALLWWKWTTDPLRSVGIIFFPVGITLLLLEWRRTGWESKGTWFGLLPIAFAVLCNLFWISRVEMLVHWRFTFNVVPISLTPYAYVSGLVLLFAGFGFWKRAWFPLLLLLLLNPLPTSIVPLLDQHLQLLAAHVTRVFASAIGFKPSTPQLLLMFSPKFGMFIAPGCDGVRGGVTLGYLALILGYIRRLPARLWALFTAAAVLLGYLLNFARLCLLVVYYRIAIGHPRMENSAKNADYVIGGCLMLLATYTFFLFFLRAKGEEPVPAASVHGARTKSKTLLARMAALAVLLAYPLPKMVHAMTNSNLAASMPLEERMPARIGDYVRTRVWRETIDGTVVLDDAAYSVPGFPGEIVLAVWVGSSQHDAMDCLRLRDSKPEVSDNPTLRDVTGQLIPTDSGLFTDGSKDTAIWNARCSTQHCLKVSNAGSEGFSMRIFNPGLEGMSSREDRPISILLRVDQPHTNQDAVETYEQINDRVREFVASLDVMQVSARFQ